MNDEVEKATDRLERALGVKGRGNFPQNSHHCHEKQSTEDEQ